MPSKVIHSVDFHSVVCLVMCSENPVFSSIPLSRSLWPADSCISFAAGLSAIYQPASAQIPHVSGPGAVGLPLCTKKNFWTWKRHSTQHIHIFSLGGYSNLIILVVRAQITILYVCTPRIYVVLYKVLKKYLLGWIYVIFPCIKHSSVNYYLVLYFGVLWVT